jgi:hypothetical protein
VKATDRTKTPEEIAKGRADELHALESRRLARMAGDFLSEDEFTDISDDDDDGGESGKASKKRKRRVGDKSRGMIPTMKVGKRDYSNPEEMDDEDDDDGNRGKEEKRGVRFTADGLMYVDQHDNVIGKVGEEEEEGDDDDDGDNDDDEDSAEESDDGSSNEAIGLRDLGGSDDEASAAASSSDDDGDDESVADVMGEFKEGMAIQGNYHASEQCGNKATWYNGTVTKAYRDGCGKFVYNVTYEDGDFEEGMNAENLRPKPLSKEEKAVEKERATEIEIAKKKKLKAKLRAK